MRLVASTSGPRSRRWGPHRRGGRDVGTGDRRLVAACAAGVSVVDAGQRLDVRHRQIPVRGCLQPGQLRPVGGSPFATGFQPQGVAFSPSGGLLAETDGGVDIVATGVSSFSD
jgi:hypothetical protein